MILLRNKILISLPVERETDIGVHVKKANLYFTRTKFAVCSCI